MNSRSGITWRALLLLSMLTWAIPAHSQEVLVFASILTVGEKVVPPVGEEEDILPLMALTTKITLPMTFLAIAARFSRLELVGVQVVDLVVGRTDSM